MTNIAIQVTGLSKKYRLGALHGQAPYKRLSETLASIFTVPWRKLQRLESNIPQVETFWALKDVSFEVQHGEALGIIGRNGAGKSTLLKILSHITKPTEGRVALYGRVGSLLEVGTGFHNELTGRENIYLNGAILGMPRAEVKRKFDQIVAFAEIDKFIDTPVKHYSSGMYMRLAFAIAAHLEPDILVVDEVLAVGDADFQKKCLGKMSDVAGQGRTVLFVSHNLSAIANLCPKTIWLDHGQIKEYGETQTILPHYLSKQSVSGSLDLIHHPGRIGNNKLIKQVRLMSTQGITSIFETNGNFNFEVDYCIKPHIARQVSLGFNVKDSMGNLLFSSHLNQYQQQVLSSGEMQTIKAKINPIPLTPGIYELSLFLSNGTTNLDIIENAVSFEVVWNKALGLSYPPVGWGSMYVPVSWEATEKG